MSAKGVKTKPDVIASGRAPPKRMGLPKHIQIEHDKKWNVLKFINTRTGDELHVSNYTGDGKIETITDLHNALEKDTKDYYTYSLNGVHIHIADYGESANFIVHDDKKILAISEGMFGRFGDYYWEDVYNMIVLRYYPLHEQEGIDFRGVIVFEYGGKRFKDLIKVG